MQPLVIIPIWREICLALFIIEMRRHVLSLPGLSRYDADHHPM